MLDDRENDFRQHWPHHYRDILDKINSSLGSVAVNDLANSEYSMAILQKSFKAPITYKIILHKGSQVFSEQSFAEEELEKAVENFIEIIGGWEKKIPA